VFDTIRRYPEWTGLDVTYVTNDRRRRQDHRAGRAQGRTEPEVAAEFERAYFDQMAQLGVREPDVRPHATEYIGLMVELIAARGARRRLSGRRPGRTSTSRLDPGMASSHRTIEELQASAGACADVDEAKRADGLRSGRRPSRESRRGLALGSGPPGLAHRGSAMSLDLSGKASTSTAVAATRVPAP
jgi:hypothetical protein